VVTTLPAPPLASIDWQTHRIIRSLYPPIDLFEDIADPADWELLAAAEAKTNPRIMETIGNLALVPVDRRVGGDGASMVMAPFTHISKDRPGRFSNGSYGVYYAANSLDTAISETAYHHGRFMAATSEPPGWTSEFRELVGNITKRLHDITKTPTYDSCLDVNPSNYGVAQSFAKTLRTNGSDGIFYPSVRHPGGLCIAAFWPDVVSIPTQARHLTYHWDGTRVDKIKDAGIGKVFALI